MNSVRTVLSGGLIFDGTAEDFSAGDVAFENDRIVGVGCGLDGDRLIDIEGHSIVPGVVDAHVHVMSGSGQRRLNMSTPLSYRFYDTLHTLRRTIEGGVTLARDASGADAGVKRALSEGLIIGPLLQVSVRIIHATGGAGDPITAAGANMQSLPQYPGSPDTRVDGPIEARRVARELIRGGADVLKIGATGSLLTKSKSRRRMSFQPDELQAIVAEARAAQISTMAHAHFDEGARAALDAGVDSIEHGVLLGDETLERMASGGAILVPTLCASWHLAEKARTDKPGSSWADRTAEVAEQHRATFKRAVAAGVRIAMGSDAGSFPHGQNLREVELLAANGLGVVQAWRSATSVSAGLLNQHNRGVIRPGAKADLCVLEGDARVTADLPDRVLGVWRDGALLVDRKGLFDGT